MAGWVEASDMEKSTAWTGDVSLGQGVTFGKKTVNWEVIALAAVAVLVLLYLVKKGR